MARKPAKPRRSNPIIPAALIRYFETGDDDQSQFPKNERFNEFLKFGCTVGLDIEEMWHICRKKLLADWIKTHPGTRPFGFWWLDVSENRCFPPAFFEMPSEREQAAYLHEHGLLTPYEKRWLQAHSAALDPEVIEAIQNDD